MYKVGTLVEKKLQDIVKECPHQYCIAAHCFKDDGRYLTYYSCHRSDDPTLCAQEVGLWLSIEFCQDKTGSTKEQCEANYNGDTKSFELKYGGYKCNPCTISGKWEGNKDFPEYLPTTKATTKESKNGGEQKLGD
ncbi:hypothetical protein niasHT_022094 [Heterodera trifolii]|uniref:Uncharacterized protein n=1 Tax=Heterodera trifolii TaxID=157864 RepID=A0ABD2KAB5_9BILA